MAKGREVRRGVKAGISDFETRPMPLDGIEMVEKRVLVGKTWSARLRLERRLSAIGGVVKTARPEWLLKDESV